MTHCKIHGIALEMCHRLCGLHLLWAQRPKTKRWTLSTHTFVLQGLQHPIITSIIRASLKSRQTTEVATKKNEQGSLETHKAHELKGSATKEKKRTGTRTAQLPSEKTRIKNTIIAQLPKKLFKKQVDKNSNKNVLIAKNGNKSGSMTKGKKHQEQELELPLSSADSFCLMRLVCDEELCIDERPSLAAPSLSSSASISSSSATSSIAFDTSPCGDPNEYSGCGLLRSYRYCAATEQIYRYHKFIYIWKSYKI